MRATAALLVWAVVVAGCAHAPAPDGPVTIPVPVLHAGDHWTLRGANATLLETVENATATLVNGTAATYVRIRVSGSTPLVIGLWTRGADGAELQRAYETRAGRFLSVANPPCASYFGTHPLHEPWTTTCRVATDQIVNGTRYHVATTSLSSTFRIDGQQQLSGPDGPYPVWLVNITTSEHRSDGHTAQNARAVRYAPLYCQELRADQTLLNGSCRSGSDAAQP